MANRAQDSQSRENHNPQNHDVAGSIHQTRVRHRFSALGTRAGQSNRGYQEDSQAEPNDRTHLHKLVRVTADARARTQSTAVMMVAVAISFMIAVSTPMVTGASAVVTPRQDGGDREDHPAAPARSARHLLGRLACLG